ncbi:terminal uridylyltransferase 4 [Dunckerocampus dactyliophorus]|uniref:terminal uridylyltransferase 4 n=1 Tax=Dunckerocampus dactyliophorus TaxID=161453 RepID=UPI002405EDC1|nr:terminal uridylyltransferase 4 [Dunckerocampus dactyliophorus]
MDVSRPSVKSKKQSLPKPSKSLQNSNQEATQREAADSSKCCKETLAAPKDEAKVSRGPGKGPSDGKRERSSRLNRLTGRTSSRERENSTFANRETNAPVTPEKVPTECHGLKAAAVTHHAGEVCTAVGSVPMEGPLTEQQLGLRQAEERLCRDYIHRLLKQSPEYPNYQYICKLCSVHIEHIQGAHKHIKEKRHKKNILEKQEENELRALPPPSASQLRAIDAAVLEAAKQHGISEEDFELRKGVVVRMEDIIKKDISACSLRLYGSCLTRFAFKTSDINIDIVYPSTMTQPEVLIQALEILKNSTVFSDVVSDFHAKVPAIICRDVSSGLMCKVSAGNDVACLTTCHLAALAKREPRLVPLVLAFRYWARLCHIDCQAEGGIPSYSFALMVIFFLQQRKEPILPVYLGAWIAGFDVTRVDEYHLTGILLDLFVRWEYRPPSSTDGHGENQNEASGEGRTKSEHSKADETQYSNGLAQLAFELCKDVSLGQLWFELLRFYTLEFALEEYIISIRLKELLSREMKNWPRRRLAIEDPFALKRNVARSLNSQMVFEYIQERFRTAYKYFACPQRKGTVEQQKSKTPAKQGSKLYPGEKKEAACLKKMKNNLMELDGASRTPLQGSKDDDQHESDNKDEKTLDSSLMDMVLSEGDKPSEHQSITSLSANGVLDSDEEEEGNNEEKGVSEKDGIISSEDLHYVFDKMIFTGGKPPNVVCSICKRDGHLKDECPEDFKKIELTTLPPMNDRFREILDGLCKLCHYELAPTHAEQQKREQILASLERFIRKEYNDKAQLCLFGSSKNGFGFHDSDLDICMTLEGHETAEKLNCKEIIEGLAKVLKKHTGLRNILPITTAKVPIVKFEHRQSGLEGDISLYNTLAQHNTRMLALYAALDPRVQFLGYMMKVFAKRCDIGDASRGSLSSYAYILMVLYFLQQRQPPVIPVLQEIFDGPRVPQRIVDGWNAFFFDDLDDLRQRLSELEPNTESVGELWLGLLRFYTEEFDFKEHVISIRQKKRLTTFEKQWTSKCIAIEDPFDLNHNLGAGVSRKMTNFIMKAFINGRNLFGNPFYPIPGTEVDYFFDPNVLTDGELAPNDRCCRICGKIGHYMKDCPKRRRMKKKENDKDEDVKEEEREQKDRRCFQCGDTGHVRRDCPEYRHLKHRTAGAPAPHMVRSTVSSQSIPTPQVTPECPGRARLPSDSSNSRQTPPYSPQPTAVSQSSPQPSQNKPMSSSPQKQAAHPQVPLSLFTFPSSHPGQYHLGTLAALGPLPSHQHQSQSHHSANIPSTSWPIHGPVLSTSTPTAPSPPGLKFALHSASGSATSSGGSANPVNLNDPSIIFAQPAGLPLGMGGPGREGHWLNHLAQSGSILGNGTVVKSELAHPTQFVSVNQGSHLWEHNKTPQYTLSPSWSYRMPQNFIQQGNGRYQPGKRHHCAHQFCLHHRFYCPKKQKYVLFCILKC